MFPVYTSTVANIGRFNFYKVQETHGHVYLVGLYLPNNVIYFDCTDRAAAYKCSVVYYCAILEFDSVSLNQWFSGVILAGGPGYLT